MIGLLVIAHAPLASALLSCARHVYGSAPGQCAHCITIDVPADGDPALLLRQARDVCATLDAGAGVLVLTDLFGATPANIAAQLARPGRIEVLAGANLPMLLRALCYRQATPLAQLVDKALAGGAAGVMKLASTAPQNQRTTALDSDDANARLHHQQ